MKIISIKLYKKISSVIPIICVDGIIFKRDEGRFKFLLVKRNNPPLMNKWWIPGGRMLIRETLFGAFRRKIKDELGVRVVKVKIVGLYNKVYSGRHSFSVIFTAEIGSNKIKLTKENSAWKWGTRLPKPMQQFVNY